MAVLQATQAGAGQKQVCVMAGPRAAQVCVCWVQLISAFSHCHAEISVSLKCGLT